MDTKKHLEVALAAHGKWLDSRVDTREAPEVAVTALDSKGLLCTEVEREFIEARLAWEADRGGATLDRFFAAKSALLAERAGWPVEPAPSEQSQAPAPAAESVEVEIPPIAMPEGVVVKLKLRTPEERAAYFAQKFHDAITEIASLKAQLAEATRPRKVWHEVEQSRISPQRWRVWRYADERRGSGVMTKDEVLSVRGDAAESIARAHAAKLDAEQGGQS